MTEQTTATNKRIAKNTLLLYVRMFVIMAVALYTSRVVLNALGVENYGVYSAVGGFIAMFGVLSNSLSAAISRFITFELGKKNILRLREVFSCSVAIQVLLSAIIIILAETLGVWFLNNKMIIPEGGLFAANWVLQFSIITFVINLISVPYNASIIAYERMSAFAYISIFDALGKLGIALLISHYGGDRLILYSGLLCFFALVVRLIYGFYCKKHLEGCKFRMSFDRSLFKEISSFAGWNFIGASSGVLRTHGINILLNIFFGPVVNAARGISTQLYTAVNQFATNFITAINPQITKLYAAQNMEECNRLVFRGARFSFFLLLVLSLPICFETQTILEIWLKIVPNYAVIFVQLSIINIMLLSVSNTLVTLMLATGDIKNYQILVGGTQMLIFPISYVLLKLGALPQSTLITAIVVEIGCLVFRLTMLKKMVGLNVSQYLREVIFKCIIVLALSSIIPFAFVELMPSGILRLCLLLVFSTITTSFVCLYVGCTKSERTKILYVIKKRFATRPCQ